MRSNTYYKVFFMMKRSLLVALIAILVIGAFLFGRRVGSSPKVGSADEMKEARAVIQQHQGLILPKRLYLVADHPQRIYFRGIVGAQDPEVFSYTVESDQPFVTAQRRFIQIAPTSAHVGTSLLRVSARDPKSGEIVSEKTMELVVVPETAGEGKAFQMLLVGDSLGHGSFFPNELARLLSAPKNPRVTFVGTHQPKGYHIPHEQYAGWRFKDFLTLFNADATAYHRDRSPFVFADKTAQPVFDVQRYLDEDLKGARPQYVHIQLGINDAFSLDPDKAKVETKIQQILANGDALVAGVRKALPSAIISVGTVIPGNTSDRAYMTDYQKHPERQNEWRWRRLQIRLARKMLDHFQGRESEGIVMVPSHLAVDGLDGFPSGSTPEGAVHPASFGDSQLAEAIYGSLKAHLANRIPQ